MSTSDDNEAYQHFKDTLFSELTENLKPVISSLTMLADDYKRQSKDVVKAVEEYINQVQSELKLLGLYLMDSIIKNLKDTNYVQLFQENIVKLFVNVFECVDEQNRKALYKLRQTWYGIFTNRILYSIDISVNNIDPAWPITAKLDTNNNTTNKPSSIIQTKSSQQTVVQTPPLKPQNNNINVNSITTQLSPTVSPTSNNKLANNSNNNSSLLQNDNLNAQKVLLEVNERKKKLEDQQQQQQQQQIIKKQINNNNQSVKQQQQQQQQQQQAITPPLRLTTITPTKQPTNNEAKFLTNRSTIEQTNNFEPKQQNSSQDKQIKQLNTQVKSINIKQSEQNVKQAPQQQPVQKTVKSQVSPQASSDTKSNIRDPRLLKSKPQQQQQSHQMASGNTNGSNVNNTSTPINSRITSTKVSPTNKSPPTTTTTTKSTAQSNVHKSPTPSINTKPTTTSNKVSPSSSTTNITKKPVKRSSPVPLMETDNIKKPKMSEVKPKPKPAISQQSDKSKTTTKPSIATQKPKKPVEKKPPLASDLGDIFGAGDIDYRSKESVISTPPPTSIIAEQIPIPMIVTTTSPVLQQPKSIECRDEAMETNTSPVRISTILADQIKTVANTKTTTLTKNDGIINELQGLLKNPQTDTSLVEMLKNLLAGATQQEIEQPVPVSTPPIPATQPQVAIQTSTYEPVSSAITFPTATTSTEASSIEPATNIPQQNQSQSQIQPAVLQPTQPQPLMATKPTPAPQPLMSTQPQPLMQSKVLPPTKQSQSSLAQENQPPNLMYLDLPQSNINPINNYLPPIRPRDKHEQEDSLLVIDGRSYRIQPDQRRVIKIYYHDHELYCDTRTKNVYIDSKHVYRMGDSTKEITLNGRRVRLMYMGKRIELWINGVSYHFRADSPLKQISVTSPLTGYTKRYYVSIDGRTMDMYFSNYKVCNLNAGLRNRELVQTVKLAPDDFETHEIAFMCPPKRIMIDDQPRIMRYDLPIPCVEIDGKFYVIRFSGPPRNVMIDDMVYEVPFEGVKRIRLNNRAHELAWGGPGFEIIIDGRPYELQFGQQTPREVYIGARQHYIRALGEPPDVRICCPLPDEILKEHQKQLREDEEKQQAQNQTNVPISSTTQSIPNFDVTELFGKLMEHNLLPKPEVTESTLQAITTLTDTTSASSTITTSTTTATLAATHVAPEEQIPDLTSLDANLLKQKHNQAIQNLYGGVQCATCGMRFTNEQSKRFSNHYDWHFRQNKREKEEINIAHSRNWYYDVPEWIEYEELSEEDQVQQSQLQQQIDADARTSSTQVNDNISFYSSNHNNIDHNENEVDLINTSVQLNTTHSHKTSICPATSDIDDNCYICKDPFDIFWDEDKEEWFFKDAIRVDNRIYHPVCYDDVSEDNIGSVPSTPCVNTLSSSSLFGNNNNILNQSTSDNNEIKSDPNHVNSNNNNNEITNSTILNDTIETDNFQQQQQQYDMDHDHTSYLYSSNFKGEPRTP